MYLKIDPHDTDALVALLPALSRPELVSMWVWYVGEVEEIDPALSLEVAYEYDRRLAAEKEAYRRHMAKLTRVEQEG